MKSLLSIIAGATIGLSQMGGCATTGTVPPPDNAATRTGQNLLSAVSTVLQDYADVQKDGVSSLWSISKGLNAYHQVVTGTADIKQLITNWKSTKGDSLPDRIIKVLNGSDAPPETKALVVAKAAEVVAVNKGP